MPEKTEQEKFLEGVIEPSLLDQPLYPEKEEVATEEVEEPKNRTERRLREKYQAEREANIAMAARLEALSEARQFQKDSEPSEYLKKVERIYGTDSPEAITATELLKDALAGVEERSYNRALEAFRSEQKEASQAVKREEGELNRYVETIEDEFNVTLSEDQRKGFFTLLGRLSPKDSDGNILNYADPVSTYELYQEKLQKRDTRAKDLSSRSMTQSGSSGESKLQDDVTQRYLREIGVI